MERRSQNRFRTTYWPAYVECSDRFAFVIMRNVSREGASFSGAPELGVGDIITYRVADYEPIGAEVIWVNGEDFGVQNLVPRDRLNFGSDQSYRSVRLPLESPISYFLNGIRHQGYLKNLSLQGACISGIYGVQVGQLLTIQLGKLAIESAVVKWVDAGSAGMKFAATLDHRTITSAIGTLKPDRPSGEGEARYAA